jgi:hypothetical protein
MRIISNRSAKFSGGGYHFGSVWPLFTGWASVGEYRYHQTFPAYTNLRANALLALDGSLGHVTEVLSGDYYQPLSTSSPHQIWSAAMVVSPLLRGMFGLEANALEKKLVFAPHVPADWTQFGVENVRVGQTVLGLNYTKSEEGIQLETGVSKPGQECTLEFRPAISLRAKVQKVELNGKPLVFRVETNETDQHVVVRFPVKEGKYIVRIRVLRDFGISLRSSLPELGSASRGLRFLSETWSANRDQLTLGLSGAVGQIYGLRVWNIGEIQSVDGAELNPKSEDSAIRILFPSTGSDPYPRQKVVIHFKSAPDTR